MIATNNDIKNMNVLGQDAICKPLLGVKIYYVYLLVAALSVVALMLLDYDSDFSFTLLLPIAYALFLKVLFSDVSIESNFALLVILSAYNFRMCILPVLCALGDFYIEPDKSDYIAYYNYAVLLMIFECLLIFCSAGWGIRKNIKMHKYDICRTNRAYKKSTLLVVICFAVITILLLLVKHDLLSYYSFIFEVDSVFSESDSGLGHQGAAWYFFDFIMTYLRAIVTLMLISLLLKKDNKYRLLLVVLIAIFNVAIVSDRRIHSLLIGFTCLGQVLIFMKNKGVFRYVVLLVTISLLLVTLYFSFYDKESNLALWLLSRTFQRYFAGPSLTAMALKVNSVYGLHFFDFFKLLFNDFFLFDGFWGAFELPDYYFQVFGAASKGVWTPMTAGSIRYFGLFFPLMIMVSVFYMVRCDKCMCRADDRFSKIMYQFIIITTGIYMIMYSIELIIYNVMMFWLLEYLICIKPKSMSIKYHYYSSVTGELQ